jgi:hypothetical protein
LLAAIPMEESQITFAQQPPLKSLVSGEVVFNEEF